MNKYGLALHDVSEWLFEYVEGARGLDAGFVALVELRCEFEKRFLFEPVRFDEGDG